MPRKNKRSRAQTLRWLHHAALQQLLVAKDWVPPEQQDCSSSVDQQEPEPPPNIKEEQEELWSSQEGEQLQGLEEADITKFPFTPVPVKSEDDEEEAQSSQLHQRQTQHMETEADGEDCGGPEPARNSHPLLQPETEDQTGDSSEPETDDSADWKETREPPSALNSLKHDSRCKKPFSCSECGRIFGTRGHLFDHMRIHPREKKYSCSVCNKRFFWRQQVRRHKCVNLQSSQLHQSQTEENRETEPPASRETQHMETEADGEDCGGSEPAGNSHPLLQPETEDQTGDSSEPETDDSADWKETREPQSALNSLKHDSRCKKRFSCSECGRRFGRKDNLKRHMITHTGEKPFSCSVCNSYFTQRGSLWSHMAAVHTGEKRFSCSLCNKRFSRRSDVKTHKCVGPMETEADGEDCGGPEPARNSHPLLQPETEDQTGDSSEPKMDDSADWKETREPQSALNSLKHDSRCKKPFSCSECGRRFDFMSHLKRHMMTHTEEKPFACSVCSRRFAHWLNLIKHMVIHTICQA
ncbi:gastrula zinc finger protein XlCGF57.1-like [Sander lucioperca]|uniref:gastrula zinc finger protein XlCGF57.1-like n=1 Tax=Sander lucioperca TaxID=283035 RepID=UPI001653DFBE|nr:gastrula zinc finger protein XlCGF57.1-like [Sander lucioperca]